jgi:hypothetical protein
VGADRCRLMGWCRRRVRWAPEEKTSGSDGLLHCVGGDGWPSGPVRARPSSSSRLHFSLGPSSHRRCRAAPDQRFALPQVCCCLVIAHHGWCAPGVSPEQPLPLAEPDCSSTNSVAARAPTVLRAHSAAPAAQARLGAASDAKPCLQLPPVAHGCCSGVLCLPH